MNRSLRRALPSFFLLLGLPAFAQQEAAVVRIGGPGSASSAGSVDPGLLDDDVTEASARYVFRLDRAAALLVLEVENTSPVVPGAANPVLTRIHFDAPAAVTSMRLVSQTSAAGARPAFAFTFDASPAKNPKPNKAPPFGAFSAELRTTRGMKGGIANPGADVLPLATGNVVLGRATFTFALAGDLTLVSALDFASWPSDAKGDQRPSLGAGKFQGGPGGAEATISDGTGSCSLAADAFDLGGGCGTARLETGLPIQGADCRVRVTGGAPLGFGLAYASQPGGAGFPYGGCLVLLDPATMFVFRSFVLDEAGAAAFDVSVPALEDSPGSCGTSFALQALILDPAAPAGERTDLTNGWRIVLGG
jgi:hypothetical protein